MFREPLSQLEVGEERIPFLRGEIAVLLAGPLGPATGDERPMVRDHVLGVDRGVAHRCVHSRVTADLGRDVRGQPGANGVGDENSPEIVRAPLQWLAGGGDLGGLRRSDEALPDVAAGQRPILGAEAPLEQERHWWTPGLLEHVVGGHEWQGGVARPDPEDDRGQDLRELR
jgi:hypothetical protein